MHVKTDKTKEETEPKEKGTTKLVNKTSMTNMEK